MATGILLSRIAGLFRESVQAAFLGTSDYASIYRAALRMPNVLQNLLGEGTLSASFIPVYAELLEQGRREEAGRVAGAIFALLLAASGALVLLGIVLAPILVSIFLPGFEGAQRELTIKAARIIFPMTGTLVLSAWALGILNSHRYFFVSYFAPVLWNAAIIATLFIFGGRVAEYDLVVALSWGAVIGGLLQFGIQLPWIIRLEPHLRVRWRTRLEGVRETVRNAGPAVLGRGVVQLSGWLDLVLASFLFGGAVATLGYAQLLYMLPISLFGMSVAAAELPELSRRRGSPAEVLRERSRAALRQIAFLAVPSAVGYLVLGHVIVAAIFERREFVAADTSLVHLTLAGYAIGLIASTMTRLFSSTFFALHDTRTPAKIALVRVILAGVIGGALMFPLERVTLMGMPLGVVGIAFGAGIAAWVEWVLLRRALRGRIGAVGVDPSPLARMFVAAALAAIAGRGALAIAPELGSIAALFVGLVPFGIVYFGATHLLGLEEASRTVAGLRNRLRP